ncbi:NADH-ubiquinone oxidoreductase chain 6 [Platanthera zijinensis]|uniref:NADH-ubiquinone oxidoreductase chain 6 n=1 Tax=Platanthera zijinensis TaxID=2320716 RepID=A0AAP0BDA5_9ASPA
MLEQEDAFKFNFREGRRIMILSISSSPALVSGLMVVRAKNPGLDFSAIAVSFLFVVMMLNIEIAEIHEEVLRYLLVSGLIGLILWWEMFFICDNETIRLLPTNGKTTI